MPRQKKSKSNDDLIIGSKMESGVEYVYVGFNDNGQTLWRVASPPPTTTFVGPAEAGHRDMKRKGIRVQDKITKPLPGRWKPGMPRRGGWNLNGQGS